MKRWSEEKIVGFGGCYRRISRSTVYSRIDAGLEAVVLARTALLSADGETLY